MMGQILRWFREHPDQYISGEQLSKQLKVSRTAVWKQIRQLRNEGYKIEAYPKKGYKLVEAPRQISAVKIASMLKTVSFGQQMKCYERIGSTQTKAFEWAEQGAREGAVVLTEMQLSGKGRRGKTWHSPPYKGLWMSMILKPVIPLQFTPHLTLMIAVALCRVLRQQNVEATIKWPNDIMLDQKKCAGILLETAAEDERVRVAVAGIGISVNLELEDYPEELLKHVTSLKIATRRSWDREQLLAYFLNEWETLYLLYMAEGFEPIRGLWEALCCHIGQTVEILTVHGVKKGKMLGINSLGALKMEQHDGKQLEIYSGDLKNPF